jgi:endonuclease/exonuclease/phosphatase family metal-dependent hydrolase
MKLRIATYNVENLFHRARILNLNDPAKTDQLLDQVRQLQALLGKASYTNDVKDQVYQLTSPLLKYIDIRKDAGSLGEWRKAGAVSGFRINKGCAGRGDWIGEIVFKNIEFTDVQRKNTGQVIQALNADILCAVEVEGMDVLKNFNAQVLAKKGFGQYMMIDSPNDPRGIDVACLTKHKILSVRSHVFDDGKVFKPVFSRDCLEVAIDVGLKQPVFVLCNHFKSQSGKTEADRVQAAAKRKDQAERVAQILKQTYDLSKDYVVVLGDLNEDSAHPNQSLAALFNVAKLHPVVDPKLDASQRYTFYFEGGKKGERFNQLDYIFLSEPLHKAITAYGFERRGIAGIDKIVAKEGIAAVTPFAGVTTWDTGASDHAGLWVELAI